MNFPGWYVYCKHFDIGSDFYRSYGLLKSDLVVHRCLKDFSSYADTYCTYVDYCNLTAAGYVKWIGDDLYIVDDN